MGKRDQIIPLEGPWVPNCHKFKSHVKSGINLSGRVMVNDLFMELGKLWNRDLIGRLFEHKDALETIKMTFTYLFR